MKEDVCFEWELAVQDNTKTISSWKLNWGNQGIVYGNSMVQDLAGKMIIYYNNRWSITVQNDDMWEWL